jgi:hypothetical protein
MEVTRSEAQQRAQKGQGGQAAPTGKSATSAAAKGNGGGKSTEEFWSKVLAGPKVKRILEKRGFSPDAFRRDYEADTSRGPRAPRRPSRAQLDAVEAFQQSGDFEALKRALATESSAVANSTLRRVVQFKALGGVKTVRRHSGS